MSVRATVLIPTFDHGPLLGFSVESALAQTVADVEVLVIGDGVPDVTRELMAKLADRDARVRFFDHQKGPRHGEIYRHTALEEARGEVVCYLSDDDLWLPDHVETMCGLLADGGFAHALPVRVEPDGSLAGWAVDLSLPFFPSEMLEQRRNWIPLSCGAHTLADYRRLPVGWETTPDGLWTDLHLWRKFLELEDCRLTSGAWPTALHFPSPARRDWTPAERMAELESWSLRIADPAGREEVVHEALASVVRHRAELEAEATQSERAARGFERRFEMAEEAGRAQGVRLRQAERRVDDLLVEQERLERERNDLEARLDDLLSSVTWRLRSRLVSLPVLGRLVADLARRADRPARAQSRRGAT